MGTKPSRVMAAAGEAPGSAQPVAAWHGTRLGGARGAPCDNPASSTENLAGYVGIEISRGHCAAAGLAQTPGDAGIVLGDFLDDRDIGCGPQFGTAQGTGQQQVEESALD